MGRQKRTNMGGEMSDDGRKCAGRASRAGVAVSVVSNAAHYMRGKSKKDELKAIQRWSDYAAEIQQDIQRQLYGFATIYPVAAGPDKEAERAIRQLGLKGILFSPTTKDIIPTMTRRDRSGNSSRIDVPVFIHPPHVGFRRRAR